MPLSLFEVLIKVEIRQIISVLEKQNLHLMLVDPPLQAMALSILEGILVNVSGRADDATDAVFVSRVNVAHALDLSAEFVFPRLKLC